MTTKTLMKAAVFVEPGRIVLDDKPVPEVGPTDALTDTSACEICWGDGAVAYRVKTGDG